MATIEEVRIAAKWLTEDHHERMDEARVARSLLAVLDECLQINDESASRNPAVSLIENAILAAWEGEK